MGATERAAALIAVLLLAACGTVDRATRHHPPWNSYAA
jgi:hypothetical protein